MAAPCEATCARVISKSASNFRQVNSRTNNLSKSCDNRVTVGYKPSCNNGNSPRNRSYRDFVGAAVGWNHAYGRAAVPKCWKSFQNSRTDNVNLGIGVNKRCYSCHLSRTCWNCQAREADNFFCPMCRVVQPPFQKMNYFDILGCAKRFNLGREELGNNYRELQRRLHPDKYAQAPEPERGYSSMQSAVINTAYKTLSRPLARGLYMLELAGFDIKESDLSTDTEFLSEIMELNEDVVNAETIDQIMAVNHGTKAKINEILIQVADAFDAGDFIRARDLLAKMQYYCNIDDKIEEKIPVQ